MLEKQAKDVQTEMLQGEMESGKASRLSLALKGSKELTI